MAIKVGDKDLFPYLGNYRPINIYKGEHKLAGWKWAEQSGEELHFENAYNDFVHVEIDGKSYQHAGSGKNLMSLQGWDLTGDAYIDEGSGYIYSSISSQAHSPYVKIKPNTDYTYSHYGDPHRANLRFFDINKDRIASSTSWGGTGTLTSPDNAYYFRRVAQDVSSQVELEGFRFQLEEGSVVTEYELPAPTPDYPIEIHSLNDFDVVSSVEKLTEGQLEEYDYDSEYENIDKINLSLSEPLRSVGDVKDRLFRDIDGLWKIERNVGEQIFENGDQWSNFYWYERDDSAVYGISSSDANYIMENGSISLSHVPENKAGNSRDENMGWIQTNLRLRLRLKHSTIGATEPSTSAFKDWLKKEYDNGTPLTVVYELAIPTTETLDQEFQDKLNNLRSFQDSSYVYTVVENLKPTIHAQLKVKDI